VAQLAAQECRCPSPPPLPTATDGLLQGEHWPLSLVVLHELVTKGKESFWAPYAAALPPGLPRACPVVAAHLPAPPPHAHTLPGAHVVPAARGIEPSLQLRRSADSLRTPFPSPPRPSILDAHHDDDTMPHTLTDSQLGTPAA
jgi:hypothetical protein